MRAPSFARPRVFTCSLSAARISSEPRPAQQPFGSSSARWLTQTKNERWESPIRAERSERQGSELFRVSRARVRGVAADVGFVGITRDRGAAGQKNGAEGEEQSEDQDRFHRQWSQERAWAAPC